MLYRPAETAARLSAWRGLVPMLRKNWAFYLVVIAPTILAAAYLYLFAANQYASETQYLVKSPQAVATPSLMGEMLGAVTQRTSEETNSVNAYLASHDALRELQKEVDVVSMFSRPKLDFINRLKNDPSAEDLLKYYNKRVKIALNANTGITTLEVRAFRPQDSQIIAQALLRLGEVSVNKFSAPAQSDATKQAQAQVQAARQRTIEIGEKLTAFRNTEQALDPKASSEMVMTVLGALESELATTQAERSAAAQYLRPGASKLTELDNKSRALRTQIAEQRSRLTGGAESLSPTVAGYDRLMLDREFAAKDYAAALNALEVARADAAKKHLYLVRVVEPNTAEKSLYPKRPLALISILVSLLVIYGIGWLIIAGIREHAA